MEENINLWHKSKAWLYTQYIDNGLSAPRIARLCNCSRGSIYEWLIKFKIPRRRTGCFRHTEEAKQRMRLAKKGERHWNWKGGRIHASRDYMKVLLDKNNPYYSMVRVDGYVFEHRLVMARHLRRPLTKDEFVHHLNGIQYDNREENLCLVNAHSHPGQTFPRLLQKRIYELEVQLAKARNEMGG